MVSGVDPGHNVHYERILVPLDGSQFARVAMRTASALAERLGAEVHVVSVAADETEAGELRDHAANALGVPAGDGRVHAVVDEDPPGRIRRLADELAPCLTCLSTHGRGRVAGALVGSVARSLFQQVDEPIVAVGRLADRPGRYGEPPRPPLSVPRLVACVDGSEPSERVVEVAGPWAERLGMALTLLTVAEPVPPPLDPDGPWNRRHGPDRDAGDYAAGLLERHRDAARTVDVAVHDDPISPADGVRAYLDEHPAGLLALTSHARSGSRRLALGADAAAIVSSAGVPVLVVPLA